MGWTGMRKPNDVAAWMMQQLSWESDNRKNVCLDVAIVQRSTAYAAVESTRADGTKEVWAAVFLLKFMPSANDGLTFMYKDMSEEMGPCEDFCPKRILDRLTPTDSKYANEWRARCRERLDRREANRVADGDYIRFEHPLRFNPDWTDGSVERDTFRVAMRGRKTAFVAITADGHDGFTCRISNWRERSFRKLEGDDIPRPQEGRPRM